MVGLNDFTLPQDRCTWRSSKRSCGLDCVPAILQAMLPGAKKHREPSVGPQSRWPPLFQWSINRRDYGQRKRSANQQVTATWRESMSKLRLPASISKCERSPTWSDPGGDALHLAVASFHRCDFLVTWNCKHLANANKFGHIRQVNDILRIGNPTLVTPLELLNENPSHDN